eukprot:6182856-Pleurochrysis_carterae.AAC.2
MAAVGSSRLHQCRIVAEAVARVEWTVAFSLYPYLAERESAFCILYVWRLILQAVTCVAVPCGNLNSRDCAYKSF